MFLAPIFGITSAASFIWGAQNYRKNSEESKELYQSASTKLKENVPFIYTHYMNNGEWFTNILLFEKMKVHQDTLQVTEDTLIRKKEIVKNKIPRANLNFTNITFVNLSECVPILSSNYQYNVRKGKYIAIADELMKKYQYNIGNINFAGHKIIIKEGKSPSMMAFYGTSQNGIFYAKKCSDDVELLANEIPKRPIAGPIFLGLTLGFCGILCYISN